MNRIKGSTLLWLFTMTFFMAYTGEFAVAEVQQPQLEKSAHRFVKGAVTKVTKDAFFIKTEEGTTRNFSIKELEKEGIRDLKVGEYLVMELEEGNQIIDIDRVSESELGEMGKFHRTVAGEVVKVDPAKKRVTLKLKDGTSRSYRMKDAAATKMAGVKEGTAVVMEIDEENHLVNDFDLKR